jgi:hypothetical protein
VLVVKRDGAKGAARWALADLVAVGYARVAAEVLAVGRKRVGVLVVGLGQLMARLELVHLVCTVARGIRAGADEDLVKTPRQLLLTFYLLHAWWNVQG